MTEFAQPGDWTRHAACRGALDTMTMPAERPRGTTRATSTRIAHAKAICATCPARTPCREWALSEPDPAYGLVAGGYTPEERRQWRRWIA